MLYKSKLAHLLSSKAATSSDKFIYRNHQNNDQGDFPQKNNHFRQTQQSRQNQLIFESQSHKRRNFTQNSKYASRSIGTIDVRNKLSNDKRYGSINNSRSLNLKYNKYIYKPVENIKDFNQQDRLLILRQQKLGKLKNMYLLKNKMSLDKQSKLKNSKARINSFTQMEQQQKKNKYHRFHNSKDKQSFQKQQNFHYNGKDYELSQRRMPKYTEYFEQKDKKQKRNNRSEGYHQYQMPQLLKNSHKMGKVQSLKQFIETPPLIPITFKKQTENLHNILSLQWLKSQYEPHLQIFKQISMDKFSMKKLSKGMYFGQIKPESDIPQGKGFIFYQNGKIFEGHFKEGEKQGLGYQNYPDQSYYLGYFQKGKRDGKGKFHWNNGQVYDGEWKNNKKQGSGIWKGSNNVSYVGQWHSDSIQGFGVLIQQNVRYEGQFKNFMKCGNGTIRFQNGQTYTGAFKQNLPNGIGDYYWANCDHYHGQFMNGKRHGEGVIKYSNGGMYKGNFQNDKKSGQGEQYYQDSLYYQGNFQNDLRHGWGILYCQQKVIFEGYWLNNSAVDEKKGVIETIIEQEQSIYEKDPSKNSKIKKYESNISLIRNKNMMKKQNKVILKNNKSQERSNNPSAQKPFQRACNCQRHRRKRLEIVL